MPPSNWLLLCGNKARAILITGHGDSPLIVWDATQQ